MNRTLPRYNVVLHNLSINVYQLISPHVVSTKDNTGRDGETVADGILAFDHSLCPPTTPPHPGPSVSLTQFLFVSLSVCFILYLSICLSVSVSFCLSLGQ